MRQHDQVVAVVGRDSRGHIARAAQAATNRLRNPAQTGVRRMLAKYLDVSREVVERECDEGQARFLVVKLKGQ